MLSLRRIFLLPLPAVLLLVGNCNASFLPGSPAIDVARLQNLHQREYTKELEDKMSEYLEPFTDKPTECMVRCVEQFLADIGNLYAPLCAVSDGNEPAKDDVATLVNYHNCICTDKKFIEQSFACIIQECGGNSSEVYFGLNQMYSGCQLYSDIIYPRPEVFFNELCLLDDFSEGTVPTEVPIMKELWPDYTFAKEWPKKTASATTWNPGATGDPMDLEDYVDDYIDTDPSWTCVPSPLPKDDTGKEDTGKEDTGKEDTEKEDTGKDDTEKQGTETEDTEEEDPDTGKEDTGKDDTEKEETEKKETENEDTGKENTGNRALARKGREELMGMAAVVAIITGAAIFL